MAVTSYPVNDALAVKNWSKRLDVEALKETTFKRFMAESPDSLVQEKSETRKGKGDAITFGLRMQLNGDGVTGSDVLKGNEESLTTYSDQLLIQELRHAVSVPGEDTIDAQRVPFELREQGYDGLRDWWADRLDRVMFNHLAGNTAETRAAYIGGNAISGPSTNRWIRAGGVANDQSLSTNAFTLSLIDNCVARAKTATPMIRPIRGLGREVDYVCFVHPDQVRSLRTDAATAGNWFDLQKARIQGGERDMNAIFSGALGIYNRTMLVETARLPQAINASTGASIANTRRAVFCGAQALTFGVGMSYKETKFSWAEELDDYGKVLGVKAGLIFGMKKTRFNNEDFGTIAISSYALAA
jgi:N4-gp56 family major capsid protein